jgi:hypothetical protein
VKRLPHRVPLIFLDRAESVFDLRPIPEALLVDLEGTLTGFCPSRGAVVEAVGRFDELATRNGLDLRRVHYVTNAGMEEPDAQKMSGRVHVNARKPFFSPPMEFESHARVTTVVGDQYLTDGLMAWRFGFSFGLVRAWGDQPNWPRMQLYLGRILLRLFFRSTK